MRAASSWIHRPGKEWLLSLELRLVEARLRLWGLSRVSAAYLDIEAIWVLLSDGKTVNSTCGISHNEMDVLVACC